jgi:hypothetical protein
VKLDDLIRDAKKDSPPEVDWKSVDEKLFSRIEQEPRPLANEEAPEQGARVVWIGSAIALAAAAAALVLIHPASSGVDSHAQAAPTNAGVVAAGDVQGHAPGAQLGRGDRIDVVDQVAYFEAPNERGTAAVRWTASRGSLLHVEHAASPLVLSLEKGAAEAQVTPVPNGEAFAIDVTASTGEVVRVAVHGTHLRVARDGDKVTVDLTEGVVSIGAPPRRGSTIGQLVTAPAHVELDARDLSSVRVDHAASAVRPAERVTPAPRADQETAFVPPATINQGVQTLAPFDIVSSGPQHAQSLKAPPTTLGNVAPPVYLTTPDEIAAAIAACGKDQVAAGNTFSTNLSLDLKDDGTPSMAHFNPPFMPGSTGDSARNCATNVIYKRTKLASATGTITVPIEIK